MAPGPRPSVSPIAWRGHGVVAGDHAHVDAGAERGVDRGLGLGPQRVDHPDHAHEGEVAGSATSDRRHGVELAVVDEPGGEGQHPEPLLAHALVGRLDVDRGLGDRNLRAAHGPPAWLQRASTTSGAPLTSCHVARAVHELARWKVAMNL